MVSSTAWYGTLSEFSILPKDRFLHDLRHHIQTNLNLPVDNSQIVAWGNCFDSLQNHLLEIQQIPGSTSWTLIFEYELPRERGRRPDVVLIAGSIIYILEYKDFSYISQAHVDQVAAYARDLGNYHAGSHNRAIIPVLVLTQSVGVHTTCDEVVVVSADTLPNFLSHYSEKDNKNPIEAESWINADYEPLPSLVNAARSIFQHEPLPYIRRAQSAGIPTTIQHLVNYAKQAEEKNGHHIALVTGVPGAGKTLVGIKFVYENHFNDQDAQRTAVFLSGNGPLVKVLQYALKSNIFVQDVHGFLRQYGGSSSFIPSEHIYVFDEAQRAWDSDRVQEKRGHQHSEPDDFLQIGEKKPWSLMIGLIGDGQEIHLGEEAGLEQWNTAISQMRFPWIVHCPKHIVSKFTSAKIVQADDYLNLDVSIRSHIAEYVQTWVKQLLDGLLEEASMTANEVYSQSFDMYVTRDLEVAKSYVRMRYDGNLIARFGLLASSKARNLEVLGINNSYQWTKNLREGPWYNDLPSSKYSCSQLREVATEFACQGLELDYPIVCWGDDLKWSGTKWVSPIPGPRNHARNPHQLRINSYRVLLTRGRDGFIVFIPSTQLMNSTYQALLDAGLKELNY